MKIIYERVVKLCTLHHNIALLTKAWQEDASGKMIRYNNICTSKCQAHQPTFGVDLKISGWKVRVKYVFNKTGDSCIIKHLQSLKIMIIVDHIEISILPIQIWMVFSVHSWNDQYYQGVTVGIPNWMNQFVKIILTRSAKFGLSPPIKLLLGPIAASQSLIDLYRDCLTSESNPYLQLKGLNIKARQIPGNLGTPRYSPWYYYLLLLTL